MRLSFDLHQHSCLSPCGDEDMTPANLAAMCCLAGLDIVALTDHNTTGNCAAFCRAAQDRGLLALPGMELCTREEIHVICLFETPLLASVFGGYVRELLSPLPNDARIFGRQIYMDDGDGVIGEEPRLLSGAADISIQEVSRLVEEHGGVAFPAHVDRPSFSLLATLGDWDPTLHFPIAEVSQQCPANLTAQFPSLMNVRTITGSDAHYLHQVRGPCQYMDLPIRSTGAVLDWLANA